MNSEPLILPRNCTNCRFFDGEGWCALPAGVMRPLCHHIYLPDQVVCTKHEPQTPEPVEGAAV